MDTSNTPAAGDTPATDRSDRRRVLRAFNLSLGFVLLLVALFALQQTGWDWRPWAVGPHDTAGLLGLLGAPLLHGSIEHLAANAAAPSPVNCVTLELKVAYHAPLTEEIGRVRAIGQVLSIGKRVAHTEAKLIDAQGKLYASATSTLLITARQ